VIERRLLPENVRAVTFAKDQPPFLPLPAIVTERGTVLTTWKPTPEELIFLNNGASIFIALLNAVEDSGALKTAMIVTAGPVDISDR
jgi:hypothetical protein